MMTIYQLLFIYLFYFMLLVFYWALPLFLQKSIIPLSILIFPEYISNKIIIISYIFMLEYSNLEIINCVINWQTFFIFLILFIIFSIILIILLIIKLFTNFLHIFVQYIIKKIIIICWYYLYKYFPISFGGYKKIKILNSKIDVFIKPITDGIVEFMIFFMLTLLAILFVSMFAWLL